MIRRIHATTVAGVRDRRPFEVKLATYAADVTIDLVFQSLTTSVVFPALRGLAGAGLSA